MNSHRHLISLAALLVCVAQSASAQSVSSSPLGFNTVICPSDSDTIVGVPFRVNGSQKGTLASAPTGTDGSTATFTLNGTREFSIDEFKDTHYVKFTSGTMDGHYYPIVGNTTNALTVDLNGANVPAAAGADGVLIAKFWTLAELFSPDQATATWTETPVGSGNWVPDGHAIVVSTSTLPPGRKTEILLPDLITGGINLAPVSTYYIHGSIWKLSGGGDTDRGDTILYPDTLFRIRHKMGTVLYSTKFRSSGEVEIGNMAIPLSTQTNSAQDNFIAIPRPAAVTLEELNLRQSGAFVASTSTLPAGLTDKLMVFDNGAPYLNKAPSATYYVHLGIWKRVGNGSVDVGSTEIPPGAGFVIRKAPTQDGATVFWLNSPNY